MVGLVVVSNTFRLLIELSSMVIYKVKEEITKHNNLMAKKNFKAFTIPDKLI